MSKSRNKTLKKRNNPSSKQLCEKLVQKSDQNDSPFSPNMKMVYDENDYYSNDGMLTSVWGPSMWHFLHTMSFNYPVNPTSTDKKHYMDFIYSLRSVLPCGKCRKNLKNNFKKLPLRMDDMKSRDTFSKYIFELHEVINQMLNKKSGLTYEIVRERYEHFRSRCTKDLKEIKSKKKHHDRIMAGFKKNQSVRAKKLMKEKEKGCIEPLYGEKSKCILKIVPQTEKCDSFQIDKKCIKQKV
jgi:hypothetical protein